jgi:hypothetical protein
MSIQNWQSKHFVIAIIKTSEYRVYIIEDTENYKGRRWMEEISISTCFNYSISIEDQLKLISNAGYRFVSIGGNYTHSASLIMKG